MINREGIKQERMRNGHCACDECVDAAYAPVQTLRESPKPLPVTKKADKPFDKEKFERMAAEVKKTFEKADKTKASVETVVRATKDFIEGKITVAEREAIYDKHVSFIQEERTQLLNEFEKIIGKLQSSLDEASTVKDPGLLADIEEQLEEQRAALERLRGRR